MKKIFIPGFITLHFILVCSLLLPVEVRSQKRPETIVWKLNNTEQVGGFKPTILGNPSVVKDKSGASLSFDGIDDGLILPVIPIAGWKQFTIEVLFKPAADGPVAPRFVHFEDTSGKRGTLEARITPNGFLYFDLFLKNKRTDKGLTLIDSTKLHPAGQWYWVALVYDGQTMYSYINGQKELEGPIGFGPIGNGELAFGVRLNKVNWFKGQIKEARFYPLALNSKSLQLKTP